MVECVNDLINNLTLLECHCRFCKTSGLGIKTYFLCNTRFVLQVSNDNSILWFDRFKPYTNCSIVRVKVVRFHEMFDELPDNVREKLVFHLDIFTKI